MFAKKKNFAQVTGSKQAWERLLGLPLRNAAKNLTAHGKVNVQFHAKHAIIPICCVVVGCSFTEDCLCVTRNL
jgi:hypothetical protein